jgi:hypothetical protein
VIVSTVNRWENDKGKPFPLAILRIEKLQKNRKIKEKENENGKMHCSGNDHYAFDVYHICLCGRDLPLFYHSNYHFRGFCDLK